MPPQKHGNLFAALNLLFPPCPTRVLGHYAYSHPVLSADFVRAQYELALLKALLATTGPETRSGHHPVFAGAWTRYGFHENAGLRAAAVLPGVTPRFAIADADVERAEPCVDAKARLFDVLEVMRAFIALLVGKFCSSCSGR